VDPARAGFPIARIPARIRQYHPRCRIESRPAAPRGSLKSASGQTNATRGTDYRVETPPELRTKTGNYK